MAVWTAIRYSSDHVFDYIDLGEDYSIFEIEVPKSWVGKTISELDIRRKYKINVMAFKSNGKLNMNVLADSVLNADETMLVLGENKNIHKCFHI